ncbi:GNAT family N-acetyltransferase [Altericroceibacterium spongiae]|uniref:GNAT family N-acetyltransferase n=1 Tax=Altericroceibacterium spongiae TaxID=2320269 RepID=A0A420EC37_9SPHN|nr:GNAT family N-acetyltransferase [Altericroceibacterium spongiae]RKF18224.1 GNAT family N-acetyltransferase [Altericroceibacterium spongiae]
MVIVEDALSGAAVRNLLRLHLAGMHENSPRDAVFALDLSGLAAPEVTVWTAWEGEKIAGIGALKRLSGDLGEIKSMRTHPDFLRCGVAAALLDHIIDKGRADGVTRLALETGSGPAFEPALALYRKRGFQPCGPFGGYEASPFNQFMALALTERAV